jgi:YesN/AraC family two-component response regulator
MAVEAVFAAANINYVFVKLGKAVLAQELTPAQKAKVEEGLKYYQLELLQDKKEILVERIKVEINSLLTSPDKTQLKMSAYLSNALDFNYTYLSNTFSEKEGKTLERYFIAQRVERAKELMVYEDSSLAQIADKLSFSSVSHLCVQFKKVAGLTPAEFRKLCINDDFEWRAIL